MGLTLVFGNKNYSSWSLRPWILLRHFNIEFDERRVALSTPGTQAALAPLSPTGCVPVLFDADFRIWDSLAICEYVSEQYLQGRGWPADVKARAHARSIAAEMHSGFQALRNAWPMNARLQRKLQPTEPVQANIQRIDKLWSECLQSSGGPWLFGDFSIADAMFAPIVLRFYSYQPQLNPLASEYVQTMLAHSSIQAWMEAGRAESEVIKEDEVSFIQGEED